MKPSVRKIVFWLHLGCGLVTGVVVAIMSLTGILIVFEHEILEWIDGDLAVLEVPANEPRPSIEAVRRQLEDDSPGFQPDSVLIYPDADKAWRFMAGRDEHVYVNPYTGAAAPTQATGVHDFLHLMEDWHRWLGAEKSEHSFGRLVTGVSNFAFLILCMSGLYLWFPKRWSRRALRPLLWFNWKYRGKARDFNWHNVIGFWTLPVLVVLVGTGVIISFGWAHNLVFRIVGEEPPAFRDFRMLMVAPPEIVAPVNGSAAGCLPLDQIVEKVIERHPEWEALQIRLPVAQEAAAAPAKALDITVFEPAPFATAGRVMLYVDPFTGESLKQVGFADRSTGLRARVWVRFLHTGEAFGLTGKIIATLATLGSLVLVYTGFALSWRRFFGRR